MYRAALRKIPVNLAGDERKRAEREAAQLMVERIRRDNQRNCDLTKQDGRLVPFINVHPIMGAEGMIKEIEDKIRKFGAKGIKLHPAGAGLYPFDRAYWPMYEVAQSLNLPVLSDSGGQALHNTVFGQPKNFDEVLLNFPRLRVVLAHLGKYKEFCSEYVNLSKKYNNLYLDCSQPVTSPPVKEKTSDKEILWLIKEVGIERVMFGSDWPACDPAQGIELILRLKLSKDERKLLFTENAKRIYDLG
jgi:hypothetical protein